MSLIRLTLINYVSHAYVVLAGLLAVSIYINFIDAESYGLVAFYGVVQAWFILLDFGMGATIIRATAQQYTGKRYDSSLNSLRYWSKYFFILMGFIGVSLLILSAEFIAIHWLNIQEISIKEAVFSIKLMAVSLAFRFFTIYYRSVLTGAECFLTLSILNIFFATLRFVAVIVFFIYFSTDIVDFFLYQIVVSIFECLAFRCSVGEVYDLEKKITNSGEEQWRDWMRFSIAAGTTATLWVAVTQVDRLVLSMLLPLADFGYFNLAVVMASAVFVATVPINTILMPRIAKLYAEGSNESLSSLYRIGTQIIAVTALPIVGAFSVMAGPILWLLTGDQSLVDTAAPVLSLYVIGNAFLIFSLYPYLLQYASGKMGAHLIGNTLLLIMILICMTWATKFAGVRGAGWTWVCINCLYFFLWVPLMHHRCWPNMHLTWLVRDIFPIAAPVLTICLLWRNFAQDPSTRIQAVLQIIILGVCLVLAAAVASRVLRQWFFARIRMH
jgi:O-antigen/teichoic acid export membrane protein